MSADSRHPGPADSPTGSPVESRPGSHADVGAEEYVAGCVRDHAAALTAALHGPARAKARMVEEIRDGLADTVAAYLDAGMPCERAVRQAVSEFGSPDELAPGCQRELTIAQARHTARTLTLTAPALAVCWYAVRGAGSGQGRLASGAAQVLAIPVGAVVGTAALLAVAVLAATGRLARRLPMPHRLPLAVAWAGTTASAAMALATLLPALAGPPAGDWPLAAFAGSLAAASHAVVASSARACRRCARLARGRPAPAGR